MWQERLSSEVRRGLRWLLCHTVLGEVWGIRGEVVFSAAAAAAPASTEQGGMGGGGWLPCGFVKGRWGLKGEGFDWACTVRSRGLGHLAHMGGLGQGSERESSEGFRTCWAPERVGPARSP